MLKRIIASAGLLAIAGAASVFAQDRVEASGFAGWSFSDGVSGGPLIAGDGQTYGRVDPKDSFQWGLSLGFLVSPNAEVGFLYTNQPSKLVLGGELGTQDFELGDLTVSTYHGYLGYNFGVTDQVVRPFLYGGLGATSFSDVDFSTLLLSGTIEGNTQFSTTWGAGVKLFPAPRFGVRIAAGWTPTYIKSDAAGWWCDPFWGCYLVGDPQYSNQFNITGGVTVRF